MNNPYQSGAQKIIPAVLLYAFHGDHILMLHARGKDGMPGKWNGLGGKLELGESVIDASVREFFEEASCQTSNEQWQWLGQLYFPNFKAHKKEDWWVTVLTIDLTHAQIKSIPLHDESSSEGPLSFVKTTEILKLDLWEGDGKFLPFVFARKPFAGTFFYENGKCARHELAQIRGTL